MNDSPTTRNDKTPPVARPFRVTIRWRGENESVLGTFYGTTGLVATQHALNRLGYGAGSLAALDYWSAEELPQSDPSVVSP